MRSLSQQSKAGIDALPPGVKMFLNSGPWATQETGGRCRENLRRSVDGIPKALRGTKRLDLFEPARRDPNYETEQYAEVLNELVKEGMFGYIGPSKVGAETVRCAHKYGAFFLARGAVRRGFDSDCAALGDVSKEGWAVY
jgi:aryl-alcohol dehydrogenase-like predicted oxidoreductase